MTEWGVFLVIVALVGFLAIITPPIIRLTSSITKLTVMVDSITGGVNELTVKNSKSHERMHEKIDDHEKRITGLEYREKKEDMR